MKIKLIFFFLVFFNLTNIASANINDKIIAKVGNEIITNYDIINEINTILALSKRKANQSEFKRLQATAFSSIKKILIKKTEIKKYKITNYNQSDVSNYISALEKNLKLENITLEDHFKKYGANYDVFLEYVDKVATEKPVGFNVQSNGEHIVVVEFFWSVGYQTKVHV